MKNKKILFVDDDQKILDAYRRNLRKKYKVETALGPQKALEFIRFYDYAIVVSDLKMPQMDGISFLSQVKKVSPLTVRIMLTGYADIDSAINAINNGSIFRFLTKPCPPEDMDQALSAALEQHSLMVAEKELLEQTLKGSIAVLSEILSMVKPEAFGRCQRIKDYAVKIAEQLKMQDIWKLETASMLALIGLIVVPQNIISKQSRAKKLTEEERQEFFHHIEVATDLLKRIPRLDDVVDIIRYQEKRLDGSGYPEDHVQGEKIPLGARILKVVLDFDNIEASGLSKDKAFRLISRFTSLYDAKILAVLKNILEQESSVQIQEISAAEIKEGMVFAEDVYSEAGAILISRGQQASDFLMHRLENFSKKMKLREPLKVISPLKLPDIDKNK